VKSARVSVFTITTPHSPQDSHSRLVVGRYIESVILRHILGYNSLDSLPRPGPSKIYSSPILTSGDHRTGGKKQKRRAPHARTSRCRSNLAAIGFRVPL